MHRLTTLLTTALVLLAFAGADPARAERQPLLMPGKETLFQRVLTRPGATLHGNPGGAVEAMLPPLQPYYVFATDGGWLEIGTDSRATTTGWIAADRAVEWKQNIVVAFANPAGRERTLLFATKDDLDRLLNHEAALSLARDYRLAAEAGEVVAESGVISIEPAEHIDIDRQFYILPILDWQQEFHPFTGAPFLGLEVASLPVGEAPILETSTVNAAGALTEFSVGIVFVIDTTISMQPYIDQTQAAVRRIYDLISDSPVADKVSFGMVGFRDNADARPELGYTTRVYLPLETGQDPDKVLDALGRVRAAETSSIGFAEDSIAGLEDAIVLPGWDAAEPGFGGRYVILITDAGPKNPDDPMARSPLRPAELQTRAQENKIAVLALHLLTPDGAPNHESARTAYQQITRFEGSGPHYFPVTDGDPAAFRAEVDSLAERLIGQISEARAAAEQPAAVMPEAAAQSEPAAPLDQLGLAMRLAYLGRVMETRAPDLFSAWMADSAIEDPTRLAVSVRLLLTKNQLSTMRDVMAAILETGETAQSGLREEEFFDQLKNAVAQLAQDPDRLIRTDFDDLGSAIGEFLADLPYESQVMEMTEERWLTGASDRREFLDGLRSKLAYYEMLHDDPTKWTVLDEAASPGEAVTAMPFSLLP